VEVHVHALLSPPLPGTTKILLLTHNQAQDTAGDEHNAVSGDGGVAGGSSASTHAHTQLQEAKAIIKQQGKELHDKAGQ